MGSGTNSAGSVDPNSNPDSSGVNNANNPRNRNNQNRPPRSQCRSTYAEEKRAALDLWASHLRIAIAASEGANVRKLRRWQKSHTR
jgi:hypothetical protein